MHSAVAANSAATPATAATAYKSPVENLEPEWGKADIQATLWLPADAAVSLFGGKTNSAVEYEGGGKLWVSSAPEQAVLYGYKFTASGTAIQLQHLAYSILNQCLAAGYQAAASDCSRGTLQWWYLGGHGVQMGPFSADHLHQFMRTSVCHCDQLVCHGPSRVWMPLWLALQLSGVQCAVTPPPAEPNPPQQTAAQKKPSSGVHQVQAPVQSSSRGNVSPGKQQQQQWLSAPASAHSQGPAGAKSKSKQGVSTGDHADSDDYGAYGTSSAWLAKVRAVEVATKARQEAAKQQAAKQQPQSPLQTNQQAAKQQAAKQQPQSPLQTKQQPQLSAQDHFQQSQAQQADLWSDTEMQEACAEVVLEAVSVLRGDQAYLEELHRAMEMEWEATAPEASTQQHASDTSASDVAGQQGTASAAQLAELSSGASTTTTTTLQQDDLLLVLVLDTNVMLEKALLKFLQHAKLIQQQQGGCLRMELPPTVCQNAHGAVAASVASSDSPYGAVGSSNGGSSSGSGWNAAVRATVGVRLQVVIPWTVLVELDRLKMRKDHAVSDAARAAVEALRRELVVPTHEAAGSGPVNMFSVQNVQEFRQAAQTFDFGVPSSSLVADDHILQCALSQVQQLQEQDLQQGSPAASCQHCGVLLVTNDKIMQLKAQANRVAVAGLGDMPALVLPGSSPTSGPSSRSRPLAQAPPCLVHMLSVAGIHPPWLQALASMTDLHPAPQPSRTKSPTKPRSPSKAQQRQQQERQRAAELTAAASSFLTFMRLRLSDQVLGWFQADHEELWLDVLVNKPPWNDLQFVEVLWHHWKSTVQDHLPATQRHKAGHLKNVLDYLKSHAKRLQQSNFKGVDLHKLSFNMGVRVMEVLDAFGQQEAAKQVEAVLSAAAAATAAAPASAQAESLLTNKAGPNAVSAAAVPSMQAYIDVPATSAGSDGLPAEQGQGQVGTAATQQQLQEQDAGAPQQDSRAAAIAAIGAAAAAVAAPATFGPCLTLAQLLVYTVGLLQAALPLVGQLLAALPATAHADSSDGQRAGVLAAGMAYEQQLRAVVQQLELLGQQISLLQQQQQPPQHQALQGDVLQLGLLLVQLCSLLLHDEAAGGAVSQQLAQHAGDFVSEAMVYLMQSSSSQHQLPQAAFIAQAAPSPAVMLQQLTAALQHLQHLLSQAMQHA